MQVVRLNQLINHVGLRLPVLPGDGITLDALRQSASVLCNDCEIWRQELPAIDTVAGQKAYALDVRIAAGIKRIYSVYLRTAAEVTAGDKGSMVSLDSATFSPSTNTVTWTVAPSATAVTDGLVFTVVLIPDFKTHEIAGWILDRWSDGIIAGAVADLASRPGVQNAPDVARQAAVDFNNAKADAMRELLAEGKEGSLSFESGWRLT